MFGISRYCQPRVAVVGVSLAVAALVGRTVAPEAVASTESEAVASAGSDLKVPCGYLGSGEYRHCDGGTGSTVMLDVEDLWGNIYQYCVGPGITNLQPVIRWVVTGAWWNGGVGCSPGFYG
jgi:hypothetical protein